MDIANIYIDQSAKHHEKDAKAIHVDPMCVHADVEVNL